MSDLLKNSTKTDFFYIPIIIFLLVIIFFAIIGFWSGWKTSLYFLSWNLISLLIFSFLLDEISYLLSFAIKKKGINTEFLISKFGSFMIMCVILIFTNLLALSFYWIVRPSLKKKIKYNQKMGISNLTSRIVGMGIGTIISLPIATFATETSSLFSKSNAFIDANGAVAKVLTFGMVDSFNDKDREDFRDLIDIDKNEKTTIKSILKGNAEDVVNLISVNDKEKIQRLLNNNAIFSSINVEYIKSELEKNKIDINIEMQKIEDISNKLVVTQNSWNQIKNILIETGANKYIVDSYLRRFLVVKK